VSGEVGREVRREGGFWCSQVGHRGGGGDQRARLDAVMRPAHRVLTHRAPLLEGGVEGGLAHCADVVELGPRRHDLLVRIDLVGQLHCTREGTQLGARDGGVRARLGVACGDHVALEPFESGHEAHPVLP
jgi:hypothetical protein